MTFNYGVLVYGIIVPRKDNYKFEKYFTNWLISDLLEELKNNYCEYEYYNNELQNYDNEESDIKKNILYRHCINYFYGKDVYFGFHNEKINDNLIEYKNYIFPLTSCRFEYKENIIIGIPIKIPEKFIIKDEYFTKKYKKYLNNDFDYIGYKEVVENPSFILKMSHNITDDIKINFENIINDIMYDHSDYLRGMLIVPNDCNCCS